MIYDTIVFENLHFRSSTRRQKPGVFKNFHSGWRAFLKTKLKTALETKRNKGKNLNGIQMIFHLNSLIT